MDKRLQDAINNIKIVTGMARLTREEHKQLIEDVEIIEKNIVGEKESTE